MADEKVRIVLEAKNAASSEIKQVNSDLANLQSSVAGLVKGAGLAGLAVGLLEVGKSLFAMSQEAQALILIQNQLETVLRTTGGVAGVTAEQVNELSDAIEKATNFDAEMVTAGQSLLLTFTKIGADVFPRATQAAVDLSASFGQDLKSSVIQLGKALNDPVEGVSALSRVGVSFSESQKKMIESMMAVNDIAGAQGVILTELEVQVAGSAAAQKTEIKQLENAWGNLRETIGTLALPTVETGAKSFTNDINLLIEALNRLTGVAPSVTESQEKMFASGAQLTDLAKQIADINALLADPAPLQNNVGLTIVLDDLKSKIADVAAEYNKAAAALSLPLIDTAALASGIVQFTEISQAAAIAIMGLGDSTDSTVAAIAHLANMAAQAAPNISALRGQILDLVEAERAIISIADQAKGALESSFKSKISELGVAGAMSGFEAANKEVEQMLALLEEQGASLEEKDFAIAGIVDRWRDVNSELGKHSTKLTEVEKAYNDLKAKVSSVLSGAIDLSPIGIKSEDLLPREDAINEDARRLADVAVNGFASPWADYLNNKFPGMFGEAFEGGDIKTKAAQLLKDFEDGLNPQLIDKEKAKERVKRMILGEASMAELAAQVTAELQAEMGGNAPADLAAKVQQALGGGTGGAEAGKDFAGTTLNAVITSDVGGNMIATVVNQAAGKAALLKTSGASNGKLWGDAFLGTVRDGVPGALIAILVSLVLPEVIAKMKTEKTKTGTVEAQ